MSANILSILVYGTLQRGEERERMWPCAPQSVERATIRGRLYDLGSYPALVDGDDLIRGELWHYSAEDMNVTLGALDEIEGYGQGDHDLYLRRIHSVRKETGESLDAYTYFFANPNDLMDFPAVKPDENGVCHWHRFLR